MPATRTELQAAIDATAANLDDHGRDRRLTECDVCQRLMPGCAVIDAPGAGDTVACPECRGLELVDLSRLPDDPTAAAIEVLLRAERVVRAGNAFPGIECSFLRHARTHLHASKRGGRLCRECGGAGVWETAAGRTATCQNCNGRGRIHELSAQCGFVAPRLLLWLLLTLPVLLAGLTWASGLSGPATTDRIVCDAGAELAAEEVLEPGQYGTVKATTCYRNTFLTGERVLVLFVD